MMLFSLLDVIIVEGLFVVTTVSQSVTLAPKHGEQRHPEIHPHWEHKVGLRRLHISIPSPIHPNNPEYSGLVKQKSNT
jgi:hypothetical protein